MNKTHRNSLLQGNPTFSNLLTPEIATLILRVALGSVLLAHSIYLKMIIFTLPGTANFFSSIGLPGILAYVVFAVEAVAGVALILGIKTRFFSTLVIPVLLGAAWAHSANGWLFSNTGGGWEYPLILAVMALAQVGLGNGSYALSFRADH